MPDRGPLASRKADPRAHRGENPVRCAGDCFVGVPMRNQISILDAKQIVETSTDATQLTFARAVNQFTLCRNTVDTPMVDMKRLI